jgi:transcription elongation factor GreA
MAVPMTLNGSDALKDELQHLKMVARPQVVVAIAEARAHGDLKENVEYYAAKE